MSGRKTPVTLKPSDLVEKRISQLFKDLREASGNVRNQNNEELLPEKKDDHLDINKKVSHAFLKRSPIQPQSLLLNQQLPG